MFKKLLTGNPHMENFMDHNFHRREIFFRKFYGSFKNFQEYYKHRAFDRTNSHGHMSSRTKVTSFFRKISSATLGPKITTFK